MKLSKKTFLALVSIFYSNLIFSVHPDMQQVISKGDSILDYAREYYDVNNLISISKLSTGNLFPTSVNEFIELLGEENGLLFYAKKDNLQGFNETVNKLDELFQDAWHDIYK